MLLVSQASYLVVLGLQNVSGSRRNAGYLRLIVLPRGIYDIQSLDSISEQPGGIPGRGGRSLRVIEQVSLQCTRRQLLNSFAPRTWHGISRLVPSEQKAYPCRELGNRELSQEHLEDVFLAVTFFDCYYDDGEYQY